MSVPELYIQTILVRDGITQYWHVLELLHVINNSGTFQTCTILVCTRIEVVKNTITLIHYGHPNYRIRPIKLTVRNKRTPPIFHG